MQGNNRRCWQVCTIALLASLMLLTSVMVAAATTQYSPPRARNYGFADIGAHDECKYVSDILDGAGYDSR